MRWLASAITTLLLGATAACAQNPPGRDAILLSNVNTLTFRANRMTTARRVSAIPQISCVGPSGKICSLYQPDTVRCTNDGYGYNEEDIQWTCEAQLPSEFKLGSTDVVCEGYRSAEDRWVLKGSCGLEYRLMLTELGEQKFGKTGRDPNTSEGGWIDAIISIIFFLSIVGAFIYILSALCRDTPENRRQAPRRRGWFGGGGGGPGGGGGYGPYPGPPPSYDSWNKPWYYNQPGWTPGFWSGAFGGAAAGYGAGRYGRNRDSSYRGRPDRYGGYDAGEGSSRSQSSPLSTPSTSTGFGSTKRR